MKLIVISGTRADYGIYRPLLFELHRDPVIHLQLVVTGMHLLKEYGQTIDDVEQDPFEVIAQPSILVKGDSTYAMSQSVGIATLYFSDILHFHQPDAILLLGDRGEMLAAAIAAHYQNIAIVHLHGEKKAAQPMTQSDMRSPNWLIFILFPPSRRKKHCNIWEKRNGESSLSVPSESMTLNK